MFTSFSFGFSLTFLYSSLPKPPASSPSVPKDPAARHSSLLEKLAKAKQDVNLQKNSRFKERLCGGMPFAVIPHRIQTFKDSSSDAGFFAQHPQFANHWYEVDLKTNSVYGYSLISGDDDVFVLLDKSTPRRGTDLYLKVTVGVKVERSTSKSGPWTKIFSLKPCDPIDGCVFIADYDKKLRKVHKFKGGAMTELCDGQVWGESNDDAGPPLFWFGHLHEDERRVVAWDGSRDIWIMIKPPPPPAGKAFFLVVPPHEVINYSLPLQQTN